MSCLSHQISLTSHTQTIQEVALEDAQEISEEVPLQIKVASPVSQKIKEEQTLTRLFLQTSLFSSLPVLPFSAPCCITD